MKNNNYPTWLVPLDIAQELKGIGFDEKCYFVSTLSEKIGFTSKENYSYYHFIENVDKCNYNKNDGIFSIPTWTDIFAWFRARGLYSYIRPYIAPENFYIYSIYDNNNFDKCCGRRDTYEEAREALVKALIQTYKQERPIMDENE